MDDPRPAARPRPGRGAVGNPDVRYDPHQRRPLDDGWDTIEDDLPPLRTTVEMERARSILTRNTSPDIPFDRSINPYRGCEHGCVYCYARPSHAWLGLSPGLDFETRLWAKPEAAALLEQELRKPGYRCAPIALGTNTDPYQPIERGLNITRSILEVLVKYQHPFTIVTKSGLITRDLDLIGPMARAGMARACLSITTLDDPLARALEPRAATPGKRLRTVATLAHAGVPTGVMAAPMIPGLNDHELEAILTAGKAAGASHGMYLLIKLPQELEALFVEWLRVHRPKRADRVLSLIRQCREGNLSDPRFHLRMSGSGPIARLLSQRMKIIARKLGLDDSLTPPNLDCSRFAPPPRPGDQLALF
ncbi:PA0069 family radical SAM protein [Magnetospira thiophila]